MTTVWGQDERFRETDGYYFILGGTDDVINVAGHRLGTREIEEAVSAHPAIATPELRTKLESEVLAAVDGILGPTGRPCRVHFVLQLPKTRSGKVLRRSIKAIAEGHDPGDLTSLDDAQGIEQIAQAVTVPANRSY